MPTPKTLVRLILVATIIAVALGAAVYLKYQKLWAIEEQWNEIGGMSAKWVILPPWAGFSQLRLGGAAGHRDVRGVSDDNRRLVAITSLPNCDSLRLDAQLKDELHSDGKGDGEVLVALLKGTRIKSLSLLGWNVDDTSYLKIIQEVKCTRLVSQMDQEQARSITTMLQGEGIICHVVAFKNTH